jgi:hypothetical protein
MEPGTSITQHRKLRLSSVSRAMISCSRPMDGDNRVREGQDRTMWTAEEYV